MLACTYEAFSSILSSTLFSPHVVCTPFLQEIDMGDSPILALCPARGRVWVGFQIGHLLVFDSTSHHLLSQTWLKQYTPIVSIVHVPQVRRVFVTLATGSLFAFDDEVEGDGDTGAGGGRKTQLQPMYEYHDLGQPASCVTAVPHPPDEVGGASHELWVGQSEAMITILDPRDLSVIKFLRNTSDKSPTPSYMAYLTYTNLVFSSHHSSTATQTQVRSEYVVSTYLSLLIEYMPLVRAKLMVIGHIDRLN